MFYGCSRWNRINGHASTDAIIQNCNALPNPMRLRAMNRVPDSPINWSTIWIRKHIFCLAEIPATIPHHSYDSMTFGCYAWRSISACVCVNHISLTYIFPNTIRPTRQHCKFLIRKLEYEEIARIDPMRAIGYLQTRLSDIIDHSNPELKQFHKLTTLLFHSEPQSLSQCPSLCSTPICSSPDLESKLNLTKINRQQLKFHLTLGCHSRFFIIITVTKLQPL